MDAVRRAKGRRAWATGLALAASIAPLGCRGRSTSPSGARSAARQARILWSVETGHTGARDFSMPAVGEGVVYAAGTYDVQTGKPAWRTFDMRERVSCLWAYDGKGAVLGTLPGAPIQRDPTGWAMWVRLAPWGTAYAVDADGGLYGMFPDGSQHYRSAEKRLTGPPAIGSDGRLYVAGEGGILGLDLQGSGGGSIVFSSGTSYVRPPALGAEGLLFVASSFGGRVYAAYPGSDPLWVTKAGLGDIVLDSRGNLIMNDARKIVSLDGGGALRWEYGAPDQLSPVAIAADDTAYTVGITGLLHALAPDGRRRWTYALETRSSSLPTVGADGTVYVSDMGGGLHAVGADGRRKWLAKMPVACARPAPAADGTVYVECTDRKLYAVAPPS
jgi:outer membrane protein assembly factor BamB